MELAIAVGEPPPAWVVDQLRRLDIDLRHEHDPTHCDDAGDVIAYVMNSYGEPPAPMTNDLARLYPRLRLVIYQGQSAEPDDYRPFVDVDWMRRRGVAVAHTPAGRSVAEAAFGLLIALDLDLVSATASTTALPPHRGLSGSTLGILGLGQIGSHVARLAAAAGMRVQYASRRQHPDAERDLGLQHVRIDQLFRTSQFVSLHVPTSTARGFVGTELLSSADELVLINNTSIPGIVDPAALLSALEAGAVLRAYSEGWYTEPWQRRLTALGPGQFVSAPAYTSWDTPDARDQGWNLTVRGLRALARKEAIPHRLL